MAEDKGVETERKLLARHVVQADYRGLEQGREPMLRIYPPMPPKMWAKFSVVEVQEYEKPGEYGEEQLQLGGEKAFERASQPQAMQDKLASLVPGDRVSLGWNHDYVTTEFTSPDGRKSTMQSPEHTITVLEKLASGPPPPAGAVPVTYAAPMSPVGFAGPMPAMMASPERYSVTPETFAKLAAGGSLSAEDMAQMSGSPVAAASSPTAITSAPAGPASPAAAGLASPVTSAPAASPAAEATSSKKKSSKKKSLKASKKKRSTACCA